MLEGADMMLLDLFYKALHKKLGVERTIELIKEAKE
jgi:hypothetical protein